MRMNCDRFSSERGEAEGIHTKITQKVREKYAKMTEKPQRGCVDPALIVGAGKKEKPALKHFMIVFVCI